MTSAKDKLVNYALLGQMVRESLENAMVEHQMKVASSDPKYIEATSQAINSAILNPDTESRVWYDNLGEMVLAKQSLSDFLAEAKFGVSLKGCKLDDATVTVTYELSNGSAIVIGLKTFQHLWVTHA